MTSTTSSSSTPTETKTPHYPPPLQQPQPTATATTTKETTTTLFSLPTECLQLILAYHRDDLLVLHSLLLVNRTFFQLTVPLLYQSPFVLIKASNCDRLPYEKSKRQVKLLWLLLCSVNHLLWVRQELPPFSDEFPVLWNPTLSEEDIEALGIGGGSRGTSSASKGAQDATRNKTTSKGNKTTRASVRFLTMDYLSFYTHHNHSTISDSLPTLFPSLICYHMDQWSSSTDMIRIRATVERALLMHRPEGIVSLAVPITRVKAVQEAVADAVAASANASAGLIRLRRIEFYDIRQEFSLEDVLSFLRSLRRPPSSPSSSSSPGIRIGSGVEGSSGGGRMLLTEIKIGGPTDYGTIGKRDLYTILQELSPTLQKIDLTSWRGAIMDLDQIPTEHVDMLHLRLDRMVGDSTDVGAFLKRAGGRLRDLQICIGPGHGGLFRWAAEKKRRESALLLRRRGVGSEGQQRQEKAMEEERRELMCKVDKELEEQFGSKDDGGEEDTTDDSSGEEDDDEDEDEDEDESLMDTRASPTRTAGWLYKDTGAVAYEEEEGLRHLSLAGETPSVLWGLMGATSAYYDRLETLTASSWKQQLTDGTLDGASSAAGGQGHGHGHGPGQGEESNNNNNPPEPELPRLYWPATMTRLVHLDLKGEIACISFDMRTLAQCPVLQRLRLDTYKSSSPQHPPPISRIPKLLDNISESVCELELVGGWFLADREMDRMGRGGVLPRLRKLVLSHCRTRLEDWEVESENERAKGMRDEENLEERRESASTSAAVARVVLPDYLQAAMPMQQDIEPSLPASVSAPVSSRTRSRTSKPSSKSTTQLESKSKSKSKTKSTSSSSKRWSNASSTSPTPTQKSTVISPSRNPPSWRHLSTHGLVRAVQNMRDLHYLHLGILIPKPPPPPTGWGTFGLREPFQGELAMSSPYPTINIYEGWGMDVVKSKEEEEDGGGEGELCLDEKSLMRAFEDLKDGSEGEGRAFPLEIEVLECRES
ncbi:hypothetical protein EC991_000267 [Linnemannia zychae]|nr:hypothetical protein EC991_000267 [Linnemannia zychae]